MYFKMNIGQDSDGNFIYPVPVNSIKGAKYRRDYKKCVCILDYDASGMGGVEQIAEEEYNKWPSCGLSINKIQITADGIDKAIITVVTPEATKGETVKLFNQDDLFDFEPTDATGTAIFEVTTTEAKVFALTAESELWGRSPEVLLKAK